MEPLRVRKKIYFPAPFVSLFLEQNLMPTEAWTRLSGAIVNVVQEVDFQPIIDCLCDYLTNKVGDDKLPLAMLRPTAPLSEGYLLRHHHHMLT